MPLLNYDPDVITPDDLELEALADYLGGRMTDDEEQRLEDRLAQDEEFLERMSPLIQRCYKHEQVPVEIEFGRRLAQRCLVPEPPVERVRPLRRRRYAGKASR